MSCSQCQGIENLFNRKVAEDDLKAYHKDGPSRTTRLLVDALRKAGVDGLTLLDIGGGVGVIQHELFKSGVRAGVDVDASPAYLSVAKEEAARQGYSEQVQYIHGNFVEIASDIDRADIVTLDRVICCYPDMPAMVSLSSARAGKWYGLVYPRDTWWMRLGARLGNLVLALVRNKFRFFVHPSKEVDALLRAGGLQPYYHRKVGFIWQVAVYSR